MPYKDPKMRRLMSENYYKNNKAKRCETIKKWRKANPEKNKITSRKAWLKKLYGITPEQYEQMIKDQNGICPICQKSLGDSNTIGLDHCHETGRVREILHKTCNTMIGLAKEDPFTLSRAISYIYKHKDEDVSKEMIGC